MKAAGREFHRVPKREFRKAFSLGAALQPEDGDDIEMLIPVIPFDEKKEFPGTAAFEAYGPYMRAGIALHLYDGFSETGTDPSNLNAGIVAEDLVILNDEDLYFECASVFEAHGWANRGGTLSDEMLNRVIEVEGADFVARAKERFGEDGWLSYAGEVAARHFAKPFSRLWYAANLQSLYYAHYDDLRLGYLWAEYQMRMRYELFALKHIELTEKNRESGQKGGQADKKRERYKVLDRLARQKFKELAFASDRDGVRTARRLAAEYDRGAEAPLFQANGKDLSRNWYESWLAHFRQIARGSE